MVGRVAQIGEGVELRRVSAGRLVVMFPHSAGFDDAARTRTPGTNRAAPSGMVQVEDFNIRLGSMKALGGAEWVRGAHTALFCVPLSVGGDLDTLSQIGMSRWTLMPDFSCRL